MSFFIEHRERNSVFSPPNAPEGPASLGREDWVELQR